MMSPAHSTMLYAEAGQASAVVAAQHVANRRVIASLAARLQQKPPTLVLTCARGSSDHAATVAKYLIETSLGIPTASQGLSVTSLYDVRPRVEGALCLAMSQSGRSPDVLAAMAAARRAGALTVALVNDEDSPLAAQAECVVPLRAGVERSVAASKSFIATLAALVDLVAAWSEDAALADAAAALPAQLAQAWEADWSAMIDPLREAHSLYVVGRGLGLGIAQEAALKFKETCGLHAEAYSAAEVRHGPMALVGPGFPVLAFRQSDETADGIDALAADVIARGGTLFMPEPAVRGAISLPTVRAHRAIEPILQIQSFYRAVNALSVARGRNPDGPPNLTKITETL